MIRYRLVRALWRAALFGFFRRIDAQGRERVPPRGPVLLVANHTNAFVDPLLVLTRLRRPVTLTAKSTLRRNPLLRPLFSLVPIVEFHRPQDRELGADPAQNPDAITECLRRLARGEAIIIFPEGVSHSDPALRPFRAGAARIALDYLTAHPDGPPLTLVPVGLHFEAKERFRSTAGVVFGEPLDAAAWLAAHPGGGAAALTAEIEARIRALTLNFQAEEDRALFWRTAELWQVAGTPPAPLDRDEPLDVAARLEVTHRLQAGAEWLSAERRAELEALRARITAFYRRLRRLGITLPELSLPIDVGRAAFFVLREMEVLLVGLPLAAWGMLNHAPAYALLRALVLRMSTDRDHFASNAVFLSLPVVPLLYALQTGAVAWLAGAGWALLYLLSLPLGAAVALLYRDRAGGAWRRARTFLLFLRHPEQRRRLLHEAREITDHLRRLALEHEAHV